KVTGYSKETLIGRSYRVLIPDDPKDQSQNDMMWQSILTGQAFTGEFRFMDNGNKIQWLSGTYNPVNNISGAVEKILMVGQFVTQDKEKVQDLQDMLSSIKN